MPKDRIPNPKRNNMLKRFPTAGYWLFFIYLVVSSLSVSVSGVPKEMPYGEFYAC